MLLLNTPSNVPTEMVNLFSSDQSMISVHSLTPTASVAQVANLL